MKSPRNILITLGPTQEPIDAVRYIGNRSSGKMGAALVHQCGGMCAPYEPCIQAAREDGASALRLDIAAGKAGAAIGMGVNSRALAARAKDMPAFFGTIASNAQHPFIPQTGAVLIVDTQGTIMGAVGASGGTGDEDEEIVIAGIAAAGLQHL